MGTLTVDKEMGYPIVDHGPNPVIRPASTEFEQDAAKSQAFLLAYQQLIDEETLGQLIAIHSDMSHQQHAMAGTLGNLRFLPWHRVFLYMFESALRAKDSSLVVPYWDWTQDRAVPGWVSNFMPDVPVPQYVVRMAGIRAARPVCKHVHHVTRNVGAVSDFLALDSRDGLPTTAMVDTVLQQTSFPVMTSPAKDVHSHYISPFGLEGLHNGVHDWVGGTMAGVGSASGIGEAPADVLFWLHHANVDRLWAQWQARNNDHPALAGKNAQLDPWYDASAKKLTEKDTRSTDLLNYTYS